MQTYRNGFLCELLKHHWIQSVYHNLGNGMVSPLAHEKTVNSASDIVGLFQRYSIKISREDTLV